MVRLLGMIPRGFLPLMYVVLYILNSSLKYLMIELKVATAIHQDSRKHHLKIEVLENKGDLHHLQINVANLHLLGPLQLETIMQSELFHEAFLCSIFAAPSGIPSHG
jgi:hypothetical protein